MGCGGQASLSITISQSSPRILSIESVMPSSHLLLCLPFSSCLCLSGHQGLFQCCLSARMIV